MHLRVTPTTNTAVEQVRIEQMALQPQLMIDTVHAQALTKPTATQPPNTTATAEKLEVLSNILKFMGQAWVIYRLHTTSIYKILELGI